MTVSAHMEMLVAAEIFRSIRSSTGGIWGMFLCTAPYLLTDSLNA